MERDEEGAGSGGDRLALYAAGFNAYGQLSDDVGGTEDRRGFTRIFAGCRDIAVLFAGWSTSVFILDDAVLSRGFQAFSAEPPLRCGFGDHEGMRGCLDGRGGLSYTVANGDSAGSPNVRLASAASAAAPTLSHVAWAGNGRVAITFTQAPRGRLCHVAEFASCDDFFAWYRDPSGEGNYPAGHHMLSGRPKQLLANTATFLLLMEDGEVYSWGDPRRQTLGRPITGESSTPPDKPGIIEALGGLQISKVAAGGWLSAALSHDSALYVWGAGAPGAERSIKCLQQAGPGEVALVEIGRSGSEPHDVLDVAVGDAHIAAVTDDHRLFVVGDNQNGQLGLDSETAFVHSWEEVTGISRVVRVACGPRSTFVSQRVEVKS